jgi:hypothetical protein
MSQSKKCTASTSTRAAAAIVVPIFEFAVCKAEKEAVRKEQLVGTNNTPTKLQQPFVVVGMKAYLTKSSTTASRKKKKRLVVLGVDEYVSNAGRIPAITTHIDDEQESNM